MRKSIAIAGWIAVLTLLVSPAQALQFDSKLIDQAADKFADSPIIKELKTYEIKNAPVYAKNGDYNFDITVFDLLACFHLTNPDSKMEVDGGGGFDIEVRKAQFAKGKYDALIHLKETEKIEFTVKYKMLVLHKVEVGTLILKEPEQRIEVIEMLSQACFKK